MQAAVLTALHEMTLCAVPDPAVVRPDDVLLRLTAIGVCGSDVHYYRTGRIGSQVVRYPYRVGHECAGVVEAVGPAVTRVKPGDLVAVEPAQSCGVCDQCRAGRSHTCRALRFLGTPGQSDGCLCEYLVMPEACCLPAAGLSPEEATLVEPLAIGLYAVRLVDRPVAGLSCAILGCGPIGLSVLLCLRALGAGALYGTDLVPARRALARGQGLAWCGHPGDDDVTGELAQREPRGLDVVFECCGRQPALDQAVALLKPGGTLVLVGIPDEERVSFAIDLLRRKEIRVQNVRRQNGCADGMIEMVREGRIKPGFMVTHRFSLAASRAAFDLVESYADGVVKAMILPGEPGR